MLELLLAAAPSAQEAAQPWFDPIRFGALYGGIVGGGGGALIGLLGALAGWLAPQGRGRAFVLGSMYFMLAFGLLNLAFGAVAWGLGQPYGIWYGGVLCGFVFTSLSFALIPVMRKRYAEAEQRLMQAAELRAG